jgi:hypothetical protein
MKLKNVMVSDRSHTQSLYIVLFNLYEASSGTEKRN